MAGERHALHRGDAIEICGIGQRELRTRVTRQVAREEPGHAQKTGSRVLVTGAALPRAPQDVDGRGRALCPEDRIAEGVDDLRRRVVVLGRCRQVRRGLGVLNRLQLRDAELDPHVRGDLVVRRLRDRASQQRRRARRRPAPERRHRRRAQFRDRLEVAGGERPDEVRGHLLRTRARGPQQMGGTKVPERGGVRATIATHRRRDHGMDERQRRVVVEDARRGELGARRQRCLGRQVGEVRHEAQRCTVTERRHRAGNGARVLGEPRDATEDDPAQRLERERVWTQSRRHRRDPVLAQRVEDLGDEQRVAACRGVQRPDPVSVELPAATGRRHRAHALDREPCRRDVAHAGIGGNLRQLAARGGALGGPYREREHDRQLLDALGEERERQQRPRIRPLRVVDHDAERKHRAERREDPVHGVEQHR